MVKKLFLLKNILFNIILVCIVFFTTNQSLYSESITVFKDSEIEDYIKNLSVPLLQSAGFDENVVNFYLVDDPNPNAFVTSGQNIFIFSGLLNFIKSDDELAGVIAHELSHITEGHLLHGTTRAQKSEALVLVSLLIGTIAAALNPAYLGAVLATLTLAPSLTLYNAQLYYSRTDEMQADMLAIKLLNNTNYNGYCLLNFMERLKVLESNPNYTMIWYSTHPLTTTRMQYLKGYLQNNKNKECTYSTSLLRVQIKLEAINLDYKTFVNKYPPNNDVNLYGLSLAELKNSNYKKAEETVTKLVSKFPKDKYYLELLGDIYYTSNQFEKAFNTYVKINQNQDYTIDLKIARAAYTINTPSMIKESLKYINISLGKNSFSPLAWHLKSLIFSKLQYPYLAMLAMAQKYYVLGNHNLANKYAKQALTGINKNQSEWIEAQDLIQKTNIK